MNVKLKPLFLSISLKVQTPVWVCCNFTLQSPLSASSLSSSRIQRSEPDSYHCRIGYSGSDSLGGGYWVPSQRKVRQDLGACFVLFSSSPPAHLHVDPPQPS